MRSTLVLGLFVLVQAACSSGDDSGGGNNNDDTGTGPVTHPDVDADLDHQTEAEGDCDDSNPGVYKGAPEVCDGIDNNCDSQIDEGLARIFYEDHDGDGYGNPDAGVSDQCAQPAGYVLVAGDCNDRVATIHPNADEICDPNDVDEDCDGMIDGDDDSVTNARIFYTDADGDGYGDAGSAGTLTCDDIVGGVTNAYDCDDGNAAINPNQLEVCDGLSMDDDCDGLVDDADPESLKLDYWPDTDSDGFGDEFTAVTHTCFDLLADGYVRNDGDCNDAASGINPDATEICSDARIDEDCDGAVDEADSDTTTYSWYVDNDGDGYGETGTTAVVTCQVVEGSATRAGDCNDSDAAINPGMDELCNPGEDIDEDCDKKIDEDDPETPAIDYFTDTDGDGYGDSSTVFSTCDPTVGYATFGGDCNESDANINPGMFDDCDDGVDNDCDGTTDNCSIGDVSINDGDAIIAGTAMYTYTGMTLGNVGDINGDGHGDLAVNTPYYTGAGFTYDAGLVSLMFGPVTGSTTIASSGADITGSTSYQYMGWMVSGNADINDDGADDLIVGTNYGGEHAYLFYGPVTADETDTTADATFAGTAGSYQYFGSAVDLSPDWDGDDVGDVFVAAPYAARAVGTYYTGVLYVWSGPVSGSLGISTADYALGGSSSYEYMTYSNGWAHSAVGDLNADGIQDLATGAYQKTPSGTSYYGGGQVYISFGGTLSPGSYDLGSYADAIVTSEASYQYFGWGISNAADYDGDGTDDLVAGAYGWDNYSGVTYVFEGPISGDLKTSDYNAALVSNTDYDQTGNHITAGDFDNDGSSDLLISGYMGACSYCGAAYLALGGVDGVTYLDTAFARFVGPMGTSGVGQGIAFVDDWDGDGADEVAVGTPYASAYTGTASVYSGLGLFP